MTYIKRVTMNGFKSFAGKTEINFDKGINTIVGPNGSGKSNISDALCFALGRLSIKSIRAAKAKNLLFMGSKVSKPANEAFVEVILDNSSKTFNLQEKEISLKRIVRRNGQSIYKINNETKTRGDVIETLAQAGIDPYGFNIILQGQIQSITKIHPEERRKIIEEVAGISIYELRKQRSLKELEKTESRLKDISTILRERTTFLKNLENERAQALRYKELESAIKRTKASIINKKIEEKLKEVSSVRKSMEKKTAQKEKFRKQSEELQGKIESGNAKINKINKYIQRSTGLEQESLHESISNLKAELEGLKVRKGNYENRKSEIENRLKQLQASIPEYETEIAELKKKSPLMVKKQEELKKKKEDLAEIEEERKNSFRLKTELNALKEKLKDRQSQHSYVSAESDSLIKQIEEQTENLIHPNQATCKKEITKLRNELKSEREKLEELNKSEISKIKSLSVEEEQIASAEKIIKHIQEMDICPLCQNKMTEKHEKHVTEDSNKKIRNATKNIANANSEIKKIKQQKNNLFNIMQKKEKSLSEAEKEVSLHGIIIEKQESIKKLVEQEKLLQTEIKSIEQQRDNLEKKTLNSSRIEESYTSKILEIEEISSRTEKDLDTTLLYKSRELERFREAVKQSKKDVEEIRTEITDIMESINSKSSVLEKKEEEELKLNKKFKQMLKERDLIQEQIQKESYALSTSQNELRQVEDQINYLKVGNAKLNAEKESLEMELGDYPGTEIIKASINVLEEKLQRAQKTIQLIGSINMRALEIYDEIKEEYDKIQKKVDTLQKEKQDILKIMEEIDNKKKKTFMKTFKSINELFARNFSQLSPKGQAFLEIENKEDIFSGGLNIVIKMRKGKYFDVTSLSGGEQTLIALSLLFAIQEHKPYHFYIFDEIDASLDKRNSERLSLLLKKYIQSGQYIIVTHNDAIITDSKFLYGVTMHDGISKILSLDLN